MRSEILSLNSGSAPLIELEIMLLLRSMITCHFGIQKVGIWLPQVIKELWRKRYIVVALLEDIVGQLQAGLEPLHANEHIDTENSSNKTFSALLEE